MSDQRAPDALSLVVRVDVELVDEISGDGQKSRRPPVDLCHPDIMADQNHIAEILAILLRRMSLPRLEIRKGPEASASPEIVHRVKVRRLVATDDQGKRHSKSVRYRCSSASDGTSIPPESLAWTIRQTTPPSPCPLPLRGRGIHFDPSPPEGERAAVRAEGRSPEARAE